MSVLPAADFSGADLVLIFRQTDWHQTGWELRLWSHHVPRQGERMNLDGHPFAVVSVAWCGETRESDEGRWHVYIELAPMKHTCPL